MNIPQVPFDLLTRSSSVNLDWTGEASDLGWAPGYWPETIWVVAPNGHGDEYTCTKVELDGTHVYTAPYLRSNIRVFND